MTKLFACFALLCLIGTTFAAVGTTCTENKLQEIYGFDEEPTEISGSTFKYCASIKAGTSCCAATIVDKFQDDIDAVAEGLVASVIKRDTAIVTLRDTTIPGLTTKLTALKTQAAAALVTLADREDEDTYTVPQATEIATALVALVEDATANLDDVKDDFTAFQKARSACVIELLNLQAAAWCLACSPDAAITAAGVVDATGDTPLTDAVCERLQDSCYDYVTGSVSQSAVLSVGYISEIIDELTEALEDVATEASTANLLALHGAVAEGEAPDAEALPVALPTACTAEDNCEWICTALFVNGEIVTEALLLGGDSEEADPFAVTARRLQGGDWAPAADEAGVTITWKDDPANVNSEDDTVTPAAAGIIKSGFVCVVALLSVFFF